MHTPPLPQTLPQARHPPQNISEIRDTMAGVVETAPGLALAGLPAIFSLLEEKQYTPSQTRLERIVTFPLGERPAVLVCLESPEPHIRMLLVTQFVTPSFTRPTSEDRKVLKFARDIQLVQLPASDVIPPEWMELSEVEVPREEETKAALS